MLLLFSFERSKADRMYLEHFFFFFLILSVVPLSPSYPTVPLVPPPLPSHKVPPRSQTLLKLAPLVPCLPSSSSLPPHPSSLHSTSRPPPWDLPTHLCQAVGHVRTRAKPGQSVHRGQHSSAQGVLGLRVSRSWVGVNIPVDPRADIHSMQALHPSWCSFPLLSSQKPRWLSAGAKTWAWQVQWSVWSNQHHQQRESGGQDSQGKSTQRLKQEPDAHSSISHLIYSPSSLLFSLWRKRKSSVKSRF